MIADVEAYYRSGCGRCPRFDTPDCSASLWNGALRALRALCLEAGLEETLKWSNPCYMHAGRNVAILGAVRAGARLSFFEAGLMKDPAKLLRRPGPNSKEPSMMLFTTVASVLEQAEHLRAYLREAKGFAEAGLVAPKVAAEIDLPDELVQALDAESELAEAFAALTPGRQRSYVILLSSAKSSATRWARIERSRERILAGKGAMER